jgi:hypothetical protein
MLLDKTELYVSSYSKRNQKVLSKDLSTRTSWFWPRKRDQGVAIANYLTEHILRFIFWDLMIQNATEVRLIIHLLKYLKTMPT